LRVTSSSSFGAKVRNPTFGIAASAPPRLNLLRIEEDLSDAHLRLARVFIVCKPYAEVVKRFDKPGTLFCIDPPYWGNERDYGDGLFSREDFARLAGLLDGITGAG
jgi:DNA adenine methylase